MAGQQKKLLQHVVSYFTLNCLFVNADHDNIVTILRTAGTISSPSRQQQNTTMSSSSGVSSESPPHTFCNTHVSVLEDIFENIIKHSDKREQQFSSQL